MLFSYPLRRLTGLLRVCAQNNQPSVDTAQVAKMGLTAERPLNYAYSIR